MTDSTTQQQGETRAPGDFGSLSESTRTALDYAAFTAERDHPLGAGRTALYWHLASVVAKHVATGEERKTMKEAPHA